MAFMSPRVALKTCGLHTYQSDDSSLASKDSLITVARTALSLVRVLTCRRAERCCADFFRPEDQQIPNAYRAVILDDPASLRHTFF